MSATFNPFMDEITEQNYDEVLLNIGGCQILARTHRFGHAEEFRAMDYSEQFGDQAFVERNAIDGVLYFGVSPAGQRSRLDEHAWWENGEYLPRIKGESCLSLTAKELNSPIRARLSVQYPLMEFPEIAREVKYLTDNDLMVNKDADFMQQFSYVTKAMHIFLPDEPGRVREWLRVGLDVKRDNNWGGENWSILHARVLMGQHDLGRNRGSEWCDRWLQTGVDALLYGQQLFMDALKEVRSCVRDQSIQIASANGEKTSFIWIKTDNPKAATAARHKGCQVVLQIRSSGHMQIFTDYAANGGRGINLDAVASQIQLEEQKERVRQGLMPAVAQDDPELLTREGHPYEGSVWYYVYGMLLNGSLTRPSMPLSVLEPDLVFRLVQEELQREGYNAVD